MGEHIYPHVLKVSVMGVQYLSINYDVHWQPVTIVATICIRGWQMDVHSTLVINDLGGGWV